MSKNPMLIFTGDIRATKMVKILEENNIGRFFLSTYFKLYKNENWAFDNGAYKYWKLGKQFDNDAFVKNQNKAIKMATDEDNYPYLAVIPDIVGDGKESLEFSEHYLKSGLLYSKFDWFLAVQDNMDNKEIQRIVKTYNIKGLFLGGTDEFKSKAEFYSNFAKQMGIKFHYGRAGTLKKLTHAKMAKADSLDSAFILWNYQRINEFINHKSLFDGGGLINE